MLLNELINKLSTARLEFQSNNGSVLNKFVVPFFIDRLDLRNLSHSIALVGSRGSGKSTYIQHFSHATRFDVNLKNVEPNELKYVLFYWKPDIAYCQGLKSSWLGDDALRFFSVHSTLSLVEEICKFVKNASFHFENIKNELLENGKFWRVLTIISKQKVSNFSDIFTWISDQKYQLSTRLNPVNLDGLPSFETKYVVQYLLDCIRNECSDFSETNFKIFIDEFELLTENQQRLLNSYRKESTSSLSWNVAYKSNAAPTNETTTDQWLQAPDDYVSYNLDEFIKSDYRIFAAEIFLLTLQNAGIKCNIEELTPEFLGNRDNIESRKNPSYQDSVVSLLNRILPTPSVKDISSTAVANTAIRNKLLRLLETLSFSKNQIEKIFSDPSFAITILGTHRQRNFDLKEIAAYLNEEKSNERNRRFLDKIKSYEFSTLISLNLQNASVNLPVYAGFERFITMTSPNVRHFKEICLNALKMSNDIDSKLNYIYLEDISPISLSGMHLGAVSTSSDLVREVISYPPFGRKLSHLVNRIGELFRISQKSSYQTEPERTVFSLKYDFAGSDVDLENIIESALSWRVIVASDSRRQKDEADSYNIEFQLNPVYAPKFGISYRKMRGVLLTVDDFKTIVAGSSEEFDSLRKKFQIKWKCTEDEVVQGVLL
ncbi:hypothetical protein [Rheinheimera sp. F8]|uniref:ORC-CDC6 family AAA ATPase n=1 Tax=Rheinheimera sp. F8 TaxID=1763998 RepID=UPI000744AC11|nr:hypothetical protein [Rheinheimera sp. F8]ALZ75377.1 hypothetical protein ATY27_06165 [Rheinheimera sp. F8]ALZ75809.1 hypothetical protein ATY27_08540 [Rheinheimera sp. F8]